MKRDFEKLILQAGKVEGLSAERRARMRSMLSEYAAMQPRREELARPAARKWTTVLLQAFREQALRPVGAALALVLIFGVSGGSLAYAAEGSLPGDALYPIKVDVTEPLRTVFALTPSAQADWQITLATRRADEAATLASRGELSTSTQEELATRFTESIAAAHVAMSRENRFASSTEEDDQPDTVVPAMRLAAYVKVFDQIDTEHPASVNTGFRNTLAIAVQKLSAPTTATLALGTNPTASQRSSHEGFALARLRTDVQAALTHSSQQITQSEASLATSTTLNARARLAEAANRASEGEALFARGDNAGADTAYRDSLGITAQLDVLVYAAAKLKVDALMQSASTSAATSTDSLNTTRTPPDRWHETTPVVTSSTSAAPSTPQQPVTTSTTPAAAATSSVATSSTSTTTSTSVSTPTVSSSTSVSVSGGANGGDVTVSSGTTVRAGGYSGGSGSTPSVPSVPSVPILPSIGL